MGMNEHEILQAQKHNKMVKGHGKFRYYTNRAFKDSHLKKEVQQNQPAFEGFNRKISSS